MYCNVTTLHKLLDKLWVNEQRSFLLIKLNNILCWFGVRAHLKNKYLISADKKKNMNINTAHFHPKWWHSSHYVALFVFFLSFFVTVMKPDTESNRQRDEGRTITLMKTTGLIFIYSTRLKGGQQKVEHGNRFVFRDVRRLTMFGFGHTCFLTCCKTFRMEFNLCQSKIN